MRPKTCTTFFREAGAARGAVGDILENTVISAGSIEREVASPGGNRRFVVRLSADGAVVESVLYRGDTLCPAFSRLAT